MPAPDGGDDPDPVSGLSAVLIDTSRTLADRTGIEVRRTSSNDASDRLGRKTGERVFNDRAVRA